MALPTGVPTEQNQQEKNLPTALPEWQKPARDPGFPKGQKNPRRGTPRARITEIDAHLLAFAAKFPGADAEAFSVLNYRQETTLHAGGVLPSISSIETRLRKLIKLEVMEKYRSAATGITSYGLTKFGHGVAQDFGYEVGPYKGLKGMSLERLTHYRLIGHVAAQFASPANFFEETQLNLRATPLDSLISEQQMREAYQPIKDQLKERKTEGKPHEFGPFRRAMLNATIQKAEAGKLPWEELLNNHPAFYTLSHQNNHAYQQDLAVNLDSGRNSVEGHFADNLLVEVELSKKSWAAYDEILRTIKAETARREVYSQAVYFTSGPGVETLLRKIDSAGEYDLFHSNQLVVLPILHRDGTPLHLAKRIIL